MGAAGLLPGTTGTRKSCRAHSAICNFPGICTATHCLCSNAPGNACADNEAFALCHFTLMGLSQAAGASRRLELSDEIQSHRCLFRGSHRPLTQVYKSCFPNSHMPRCLHVMCPRRAARLYFVAWFRVVDVFGFCSEARCTMQFLLLRQQFNHSVCPCQTPGLQAKVPATMDVHKSTISTWLQVPGPEA